MTKRRRAIRAGLAMGWGVLVVALWMGLIGGVVATAHAGPDVGKTTTQSANDSGKPTRDKVKNLGPRNEKQRRAKDRAGSQVSVTKESTDETPPRQRANLSKSLPTRSEVRGLVDDITAQARTALTDLAARGPQIGAARTFPRTKPAADRDGAEVSESTGLAATEHPVANPIAAVDDAIGGIARAVDPKPFAEVSAVADRIVTQGRAVLADIADQVSNTRSATAPRPIAQLAAAVNAPAIAPRSAPLVNIVGSLVFNVVGAALQVFSGPPVLPPGSNVTVRSSTLDMPGTGQTVRADWYFPEDPDSATGVIYLQHGFMATGPMYSYTAAYLAEETNSIVVVPTLSSNLFDPDAEWIGGEPMQQSVADLFAGDRPELTASASAAAGHPVELPSKFVLVGHSLGGMLVTGAAGRMVDNGAVDDLAGVVLLDAVDTNGDMPEALGNLSGPNDRPVLLISSERYVWNLDGTVGDELQAARPGEFNGVMLVGGRHIDALHGGNPILQFAEYLVAGFSQPQNVDAVKIISADWINDMYAGNDITGTPQEIPTSAGTATTVALPFTSDESVQATPWDGLSEAILDVLFRYAVYEPLAGQSVPVTV